MTFHPHSASMTGTTGSLKKSQQNRHLFYYFLSSKMHNFKTDLPLIKRLIEIYEPIHCCMKKMLLFAFPVLLAAFAVTAQDRVTHNLPPFTKLYVGDRITVELTRADRESV